MKNNKLKVLSTCLILSFTALGVVACNNNQTSSSQSSENSISSSETSSSINESSSVSVSESVSESSSVVGVEAVVILNKYTTLTVDHEPIQLEASVDPEQLSQEVVWNSSDEGVATVNNGLLVITGIGETTIKATSAIDETKFDSFSLKVTGTIVEGTVTTLDMLPIANVEVKLDEKKAQTDDKGKYKLILNGKETSKVLSFSKEGYNTREIDLQDEIVDGTLTKDIMLYSPNDNVTLTFKGDVKNVIDGGVDGAKITINNQETTSIENGSFEINNLSVNQEIVVKAEKDGYVAVEKTYRVADYLSDIENGNKVIELGTLDLYKQQDDINILARNGHNVKGHIYRTLTGLKFTYDADFDITTNGFNYELFLDFGDSKPSDMDRSDSRDSDFKITYQGIEKAQKYGDNFGEGEATHKYYVEGDHHYVEVEFPYTYLKADKNEIFGFNVISHDTGVGDRSFNLFGNDVEWYNKWSYPRLGLNNDVYQGNNNELPLSLTQEGVISSQELGVVGEDADRKYSIKLAKDNEGIYIITDKVNKEKSYILDNTHYHFFIDTEQENFDRATDSKISHYKIESGRWATKYNVQHANSVFNDGVSGNDFMNLGLKIISKAGYLQLFIPYSFLGNGVNKDSIIGIAANMEEGSNNWKSWNAPNISGWNEIPHVEQPKSFVRLDKDMNVIPA